MKTTLKLLLSLIVAITFAACGSSHHDNGNKEDSHKEDPVKPKPTAPKTVKATVYDDLLIGLTFKTQNGTSGKTDSNGQFDYEVGKVVEFFIGEVKIGSISSLTTDQKVFISDMLDLKRGDYTNPKLVKIAQILQALDSVPNDGKKITLDEQKAKEISDIIKEKNKTLDTLNVEEDLKDVSLTIPSKEVAKENVKDTLTNEGVTPIAPAPEPDTDNPESDDTSSKPDDTVAPTPVPVDSIDELNISQAQKDLLKAYRGKGIDLSNFIGEVDVKVKVTTGANGSEPFDKPSEEKMYAGQTTIALNENATEDKILIDMTKNAFGLSEFLQWVFRNETIENTEVWMKQPAPKAILKELGDEKVNKWKNKDYIFDVAVNNIEIKTDKSIVFVKENGTYGNSSDFLDDSRVKDLSAIDFNYRFALWDELKALADSNGDKILKIPEDSYEETLKNSILYGGSVHPNNYIGYSTILDDDWGESNFVEPKGTFSDDNITFVFNIDHSSSSDYDKVEVTFSKN